MKHQAPTADQVRALLDYNPDTGIFRWKVSRGGVLKGAIAGSTVKHGYRCIRILNCSVLAHRLAWLVTYDHWPRDGLDHRNRIPGDNRIVNLREATQSQNNKNSKLHSSNRSGFRGVSWDSINSKWVARIRVPGGPYRNLGRFNDPDIAHKAYRRAARQYYGEFSEANE
ncbi:HNH endonuclease [Burkholderia contaminans]|uniref:HNH endonuclease n=1 Tax=Burkholderia contaminans TaxID=488447 RepID=UPI003BF82A27